MMKFWTSGRGRREIERRLRADAPVPAEELVARIAASLEPRGRAGRVWSRVAFAGAVTTFMLGTFASFGGLGYAAATAESAGHTVKQVVAQAPLVREISPAAAEYGEDEVEEEEAAPTDNNNVAGGQQLGEVAGAGTLPFTGISLLVTVLISGALMASGFALRRAGQRSTHR
jgi:hypothetical protein